MFGFQPLPMILSQKGITCWRKKVKGDLAFWTLQKSMADAQFDTCFKSEAGITDAQQKLIQLKELSRLMKEKHVNS